MTTANCNPLNRAAISLEDYIEYHPEVKRFLNNDSFWNRMETTAQIPLNHLRKLDPTCVIVGKEHEIRVMKIANYNASQIQEKRVRRFNDLRMLCLEIDYMKRNGLGKTIRNSEQGLKENLLDWEQRYERIISDLEKSGKYNRNKALSRILGNFEKTLLQTEVDYEAIALKMSKEFFSQMVTLEGPYGSGKSLMQSILMESYSSLCKNLGIKGFELMSIQDPPDKDKAKLIKLVEGEGQRLMDYCDSKQERKTKIKKALFLVGGIALSTPPLYFLSKTKAYQLGGAYIWNEPNYLKELGNKIHVNLDKIFLGTIAAAALGHFFMRLKDKKSKQNDRPVWVSQPSVQVYGGPIDKKDIVGEYRKDPNRPIQESIVSGSFLAGDGSGIIIEKQAQVSFDVQSLEAEVIQEGIIPVADGKTFTDIFMPLYIGINPSSKHEIQKPLLDRFNLGTCCYVTNEVERTKETERQFNIFLEYFRKDALPFRRDAVERLLEISTILAEDTSKLCISRKFLKILDKSINNAREEERNFVTSEHVNHAASNARSLIEQDLHYRLMQYNSRKLLTQENLSKAGIMNIISYLTDMHLVDEETNDPELQKRLAEDNGLGYILTIRANSIKTENEKGQDITVITPVSWDKNKKDEYQEKLSRLLIKNGYMNKQSITIDITDALNEDDTLLAGMYIAALSAINNKPMDSAGALLASISFDGSLKIPSKMNKRLFTLLPNNTPIMVENIYVPSSSIYKVINPDYYDQLTFHKINGLEELLMER